MVEMTGTEGFLEVDAARAAARSCQKLPTGFGGDVCASTIDRAFAASDGVDPFCGRDGATATGAGGGEGDGGRVGSTTDEFGVSSKLDVTVLADGVSSATGRCGCGWCCGWGGGGAAMGDLMFCAFFARSAYDRDVAGVMVCTPPGGCARMAATRYFEMVVVHFKERIHFSRLTTALVSSSAFPRRFSPQRDLSLSAFFSPNPTPQILSLGLDSTIFLSPVAISFSFRSAF